METIEHIISLPPGAARHFRAQPQACLEGWHVGADPDCRRLGSGGGTAGLLADAWQVGGPSGSLESWIEASRKLLVHGGGESRRLPAYAAAGKPLIPVPALRGSWGQRLDQTLLDLQAPVCRTVLEAAPARYRLLVASGDVLLRFGAGMAPIPPADVAILGMRVEPETARHFGVLFVRRDDPARLAFLLQKPSVERIVELSATCDVLVDTGVWLLSARAIAALMARSGWDPTCQGFPATGPAPYELYAGMGLALGAQPTRPDEVVSGLACAVVPLPCPEFYHLGTSRHLVEAVSALQTRSIDDQAAMVRSHPNQIVQNAAIDPPIRSDRNHTLWIENACIGLRWRLAHDHVLTGVPDNDWAVCLEPGVCLDCAPVGDRAWCVRPYGIDDAPAGPFNAAAWLGRPAVHWLATRGIAPSEAGIDPGADVHDAPLHPLLHEGDVDGPFLEWLTAAEPAPRPDLVRRWLRCARLSSRRIAQEVRFDRLDRQRTANRAAALCRIRRSRRSSVFYRLDLRAAAGLWDGPPPAPTLPGENGSEMADVHEQMFCADVLRRRGLPGAEATEAAAFDALRRHILGAARSEPVRPACAALADQLVWARAPARVDLAGGWTDTPPYCIEHGGRVTNAAVELNGQPPIHVFARPAPHREIVVRSVDLGIEERIRTYEDLDAYARPGSGFALARAALALAGFLPRFHRDGGFPSLAAQLDDFGAGIELSLVAAVPAGSGLGASSILAATLLAALSDLCALGWDTRAVMGRTLAVEQMVTTGGGWQDQAGGALRGLKLLETARGPAQDLTVRWLPEHLFEEGCARGTILLYYTGVTRMAKGILQEIVRGMFLNAGDRLAILKEIGENASFAADVLQRGDWEGLCEAVRRSWDLNRRLDAETDPPAVQAIVEPIRDRLAAYKLLGAGGGGYLLLLAKDEAAGRSIRAELAQAPARPTARIVQAGLSMSGLHVTRS